MKENGQETPPTVPHVGIVGGGVGGLEAAKKLGKQPVRVTVNDQRSRVTTPQGTFVV